MIRAASIIWVLMICPGGFSQSNRVKQNPPDLFGNQKSVKIQCEHSVPSYNQINWYRQDQGLTFIGYQVGTSPPKIENDFTSKVEIVGNGNKNVSLTIKNLLSNDSAVYFCAAWDSFGGREAHFGEGTRLTVLDNSIKITEPKRVSLLNVSENEVCTKTNVTLVCVAEGFYPDHVSVSWSVDGEKRETDVSTDEAAIQNVTTNFYSISSRLNINYKDEWTKGKEFTCTVSFFNGTVYTEHSDSYRSPKNLGENLVEKYIQSANVTMLAYGMFIGKSIAYGLFILYVIKRQGFISK